MKRILPLFAAALLLAVSCEEKIVDVDSLSLDRNYLEIKVGETCQLNAAVLPENATDKTLNWWTSSTDVSCRDGLVKAGSVGVSTVTVSHNDLKDTCRVVAYEGTFSKDSKSYPITKVSAYTSDADPDFPGTESFSIIFACEAKEDIENVELILPAMYLGQTIDMTAKYPFIECYSFPQWAFYSYTNNNENFLGTYYNFGDDEPVVVNNVWEVQSYRIEKGSFCVTQKGSAGRFEVSLDVKYTNGAAVKMDWTGAASVKKF